MFSDDTRKKLENIIQGVRIEREENTCTATRNFLSAGFSTSKNVKQDFEGKLLIKKEQEQCLREFATATSLWVTELPGKEQFLAKGGESSVYLDKSQRHVIKTNDCIYYATWLEYFDSLLLHNILFEDTAYSFLGFTDIEGTLCAVVKQPFIVADSQADLKNISEFLQYNGFENTKRQDYFNKEYGLILEDMHDENVIAKEQKLFFIDTVFFIVDI